MLKSKAKTLVAFGQNIKWEHTQAYRKAHVRACFENFNFKLESKSMHASFACLMFFAPSFQNKISEG